MRPYRVTVFARAPEVGRVKTRLAAAVGESHALAVYQWLGARAVRLLCAPVDRAWDVHVAYTPAAARHAVRAWLGPVDGMAVQPDGDLGERMEAAVDQGLAAGHRGVVLVGTDCPGVTAERVHEAVTALQGRDAVLGPAMDGGYYLLGLSRRLPVFRAMTWSTDTVAAVTRARLKAAGAVWAELPVETDVDTEGDLATLAGLSDAPAWVRQGVTSRGTG